MRIDIFREEKMSPPVWAALLSLLLQYAAYTVIYLHLFLIRKEKLPEGCIRDKALSMSGPNEDSTFWFLK